MLITGKLLRKKQRRLIMKLEKNGTTERTQIIIHEKMTIAKWLSVMRKSYRRCLQINREDLK